MFERNYATAPPVVLGEDDSAVVKREVREMLFALNHLATSLAPGQPVDRELVHSILYVSESRLAEIGKLTQVETDSALEREQRHARLRAANLRIHELEQQLGGAVSADQTKQAVSVLADKLQAWWRHKGLGHVQEATTDSYGSLRVVFSCTLFGNTALTGSKTPVSDKTRRQQWLESLEQQGFVLESNPNGLGNLRACDQSRQALMRLIRETLPSAFFQGLTTSNSRSGVPVFREIRVCIDRLEDISALPDVSTYQEHDHD